MAVDLSKFQVSDSKESASWMNKDVRFRPWKFSAKRKQSFYATLSTLIAAGLDSKSALDLISTDVKSEKEKRVIRSLSDQLLAGSDLATAMDSQDHFGLFEIHSVRIGESSGKLVAVLDELASHFERKVTFQRTVTRVMAYPLFVLVISGGVIWFMLAFVVPMFAGVFERFDAELPRLTQLVVNMSAWVKQNGWVLPALAVVVLVVLYLIRKNDTLREKLQQAWLRVPLFGKMYASINEARICQSMHLLLASGNPLSSSLEMSAFMVTSLPHRRLLTNAQGRVLGGATLSESLEEGSLISSKVVSLVKVGEQSGKLPSMFETLSVQLRTEVEHRSSILSTLLEPALIVLLALIVGFILIAMYLPLFELGKVLK